jgi:hypothetical protein
VKSQAANDWADSCVIITAKLHDLVDSSRQPLGGGIIVGIIVSAWPRNQMDTPVLFLPRIPNSPVSLLRSDENVLLLCPQPAKIGQLIHVGENSPHAVGIILVFQHLDGRHIPVSHARGFSEKCGVQRLLQAGSSRTRNRVTFGRSAIVIQPPWSYRLLCWVHQELNRNGSSMIENDWSKFQSNDNS